MKNQNDLWTDRKRRSVDISTDLEKRIQEIADKKKWSWSFTAFYLLEGAVKRRERDAEK